MDWMFRQDLPIYTQLTEQLTLAIISGEYSAGARLPSVRDLALEAGVNPNTMQRALTELERDGLVYAQRTAGRFVTEDYDAVERARLRIADEKAAEFLAAMEKLGFSRAQIPALLQQAKEETK